MKKLSVFLVSISLMTSPVTAQLPTYNWAFTLGSTVDDILGDLITDPSGNVYLTGYTGNVMDMDPGPGSSVVGTPGSQTFFLAKYNPNGELDWAINWPGRGAKLGIDDNGNVIVAGAYTGTISIGGSAHTSQGWEDIFLASVSPSGIVNWSFSIGGTEPDSPSAVTIAPGGDIYLGGRSKLSVDFDPGPGTYVLTGLGQDDGFFARYTPQGQFVWAKLLTTTFFEEVGFIDADSAGMLYVGGTFYISLDFSMGAGTGILTSVGNQDHFIAAYDTSGSFQWVRQFGGVGNSSLLHTALGNNWNGGTAIAVTGNFLDTLYIGTTSTYNAQGMADIYALVFDASGNNVSSFTLGGSGEFCFAGDVVLQDNGLILAGAVSGTVDLDPRAGFSQVFSASAQKDLFLAYYSNVLEPLAIYTWEGAGEETTHQLWQDVAGNLFLDARFDGTFYQQPLAMADQATSIGGLDISVIKMGNNTIPSAIAEFDPFAVSIHPVPANDQFTIQADDGTSAKQLTITNAVGAVVLRRQLPVGQEQWIVDCSAWDQGFYLVEVRTAKGRSSKAVVVGR